MKIHKYICWRQIMMLVWSTSKEDKIYRPMRVCLHMIWSQNIPPYACVFAHDMEYLVPSSRSADQLPTPGSLGSLKFKYQESKNTLPVYFLLICLSCPKMVLKEFHNQIDTHVDRGYNQRLTRKQVCTSPRWQNFQITWQEMATWWQWW